MNGDVTVLISTSPILSHPSTLILARTVASVRQRLPDVRIIVLCDGVHSSLERYRPAYEAYERRLVDFAEMWGNVDVVTSPAFVHQSGTLKLGMPLVDTPLVMFVEHDLMLVGDVPFDIVSKILLDGDVDVVRLYINTELESYHAHMFLDHAAIDIGGLPVLRTWQWSQNPHVARTDYYQREVVDRVDDRPRYVEEIMSGVLSGLWSRYGDACWNMHKVVVFYPPGDTRRVLHLDGREGDAPVNDS